VDFFKVMEHPTEGAVNVARYPVRFGASPADTRRLAPNLGEHNSEFLKAAAAGEAA
jgi:crotonobetainyl-CoA:carnitine CoA-transferase CaiB-like acyl-CoA transferase